MYMEDRWKKGLDSNMIYKMRFLVQYNSVIGLFYPFVFIYFTIINTMRVFIYQHQNSQCQLNERASAKQMQKLPISLFQ